VIFGIGTDIVRVNRMQHGIDRFGDEFARRILAQQEFDEYVKISKRANFLAKRFAAKEATAKAMGLGFRNGLRLKDIAVTNDNLGKPLLKLSGYADKFACEHDIVAMNISLSDEQDYAVAFVILER